MSEMIERVARAIHTTIYGSDVMWRESVPAARAAIEAMREPTKPMVLNGALAMSRDDLEPTEAEFADGYKSAIDAALQNA